MAPTRRKGPLQLVQREIDDIKRKVDGLVKDQNQTLNPEEAYQRCQEVQSSAEKAMGRLKRLTKTDEPAPVGNYDQRKQEEERRLQTIMGRLNTLSLELSPPGPSSAAGEDQKEESDDDDEEDEDDEDDSDEEVDKHVAKSFSQSDPHVCAVLSDFKGEQDGDLSVKRGELLRIINKTADGWWLALDTKGNRGVVPKTYLQEVPTNNTFQSGDGVDDEDDDDDDSTDDDNDDDDKDLNEKDSNIDAEEEEDGDELTEAKDRKRSSSWSTVRKALIEIDATDVLSAMGAIPSGFRPSTLNKLLVDEGITYRASRYIQPELSQSQLSFKDLFLDTDTGRVRSRSVKTSICFTLWGCRMIPTPGVGIQVLSRHIRLCAFDGTQVLSNIHTVRATYNDKNPKTWTFSPRMAGLLPIMLDGECFLRCSSDSPDLGILFELGVTFIRNSTGERGDLSCGWAFLKLTDDTGAPITARTYELPVNGGTPYERDVAMEYTASRESTVFHQMLQSRRQPKVILKLKSANSRTRTQLSVLPDTLLFCLSSVHLLALHRQLLADTLLMDRPTMQDADLMCSPILASFPVLLDQTDLLDALRSAWLDAESNMSRAQRRDLARLKQEFNKVYLSSVYYLQHTPSLPCQRWADQPCEEQRARVTYATVSALKDAQHTTGQSGSLQVFIDPEHCHRAFDIAELTYDLLRVAR